MGEGWGLQVILIGAAMVVLVMWTPTRMLITGVFSTFLTPAFLGFLKAAWLWVFWLVKKIWGSHQLLLRNLLTPHRIIFPSIETDREKKERQRG
jgi:hypothetical protein